jgi:predicted ribosome quality control (RQC) complex YloA/Tae2 family protein
MVYFFKCISDPSIVIYMGKDKFENEDLIKFAWPDRDVWFHVANLSSAHVYLRVPEGTKSIKEIPSEFV